MLHKATSAYGYVIGDQQSLTALLQPLTSVDVSSSSASSYLDYLQSLPLPELLRQPSLISVETSTVESDLTNLCFREYPTFISVHRCSSAVKSAFDDFSDSLEKLIGSVPALEDECQTFSSSTSKIQRIRSKASLVQEHQDKLLDLLEIPQLMETCVRNGYYQEAMELLDHSRTISQRYEDVVLVQDVVREVEGVLQLMLTQLLSLLREPIKLPALIKTVTFLRRLHALDENELALVFISSRYRNFKAQLAYIERDKADPVRYLRRYIDLFREHVYDLIAQFTTIFLDSPNTAIHIASFASQAVSELVNLVWTCVPQLSADAASMSSILIQLGYCAMSFTRVGLDFAPLIAEPFASTSFSTFCHEISNASRELRELLEESSKLLRPPSQILITADHLSRVLAAETSPPNLPDSIDAVRSFPPLAALVNAHLNALNSLRLLAPLNLRSQIFTFHSTSLASDSVTLLQYFFLRSEESVDRLQEGNRERSSHTRTTSAPRLDLLRRNSEVQMTPEARAAKKKSAKRTCIAAADMWCNIVVPFLVERLAQGVFGDENVPIHSELSREIENISGWIRENGENNHTVKLVP